MLGGKAQTAIYSGGRLGWCCVNCSVTKRISCVTKAKQISRTKYNAITRPCEHTRTTSGWSFMSRDAVYGASNLIRTERMSGSIQRRINYMRQPRKRENQQDLSNNICISLYPERIPHQRNKYCHFIALYISTFFPLITSTIYSVMITFDIFVF